ncbi:ABC transporter substrate-binding protein [Paenibacillus lentus]|uniref:Extracellular solute-binding protein n=1 Tax=Paenibacillus lentus TaxID=1338368 RepID=A0A3S8RQL8_9BACL|nr:extracellular solute-binding protein [Paenibacillus lentus]AZK45139.1 extracellular solute-binding protein [Paenibacillus lentus]
MSERDLVNKMKKLPIIFVLLILLTACNTTNHSQGGQIKVLYWNQDMFNTDYGELFYLKYPDIEVEVVPLKTLVNRSEGSIDELVQQIEQANIDVIFTRSLEEYLAFSNRGVLEGLEEWIQKDHFDIENLNPHIISLLRENASNRLNGLAPMFSSIALFYNKDMFDQLDIEYPQDQLSWREFFGLAARFSDNKEGTYGFSFEGALYEFVGMVGRAHGLNMVSVNNSDVWIMHDTEAWENILATVQEVYRSGAIHLDVPVFAATHDVKEKEELFIRGKSAMILSTTSLIEQYENSDKSFSLGIVTVPEHPTPKSYLVTHLNRFIS